MIAADGVLIRGYVNRQSVRPGERIQFHLSSLTVEKTGGLAVAIVRLGLRDTMVLETSVDVPMQPLPARPWLNNAWSPTLEVIIGADWAPGVYALRLLQATTDAADISFIVRPRRGETRACTVVQLPTNTVNAYNNWGGKSLYSYNSEQQSAVEVSFDRPQQAHSAWPRGFGFREEWNKRIRPLAHWLELTNQIVDYIANTDLHEEPDLLSDYALFVSAGHDEYWTWDMRRHVDAFVASGGNVAILGGNTCCWQARLTPDDGRGRRLVCYRDGAADPVPDPRLKTVLWSATGMPENASFGAGFARGAWKGSGHGGRFRVWSPDHWVFAGVETRDSEMFGTAENEALLGYETNGVDWMPGSGGRPVPAGSDGTPDNFEILAMADLPHWEKPGNAAMGLMTRPGGGVIFNAATTDWACGLMPCLEGGDPYATTTAKVTRNVLTRLSASGKH